MLSGYEVEAVFAECEFPVPFVAGRRKVSVTSGKARSKKVLLFVPLSMMLCNTRENPC